MNFDLTVSQDFGPYAKGDVIHDPAEVKAVLASENAARVIKVAAGTHAGVVAAPKADDHAG